MASGAAPPTPAATPGDHGAPDGAVGRTRRFWQPPPPERLIGREEESAFAESALKDFIFRSRATSGGPGPRTRGLVIAAPAGIGKTSLLSDIARTARNRGFATVSVTGSASAREIPLGPFVPVLPDPTSNSSSPSGAATGHADSEWDLVQSVRAAVLSRGRGRGTALLVDDAHLLDGPSAALIRQLAAAGQAFVVVALRPVDDVPADIRSLWKEGLALRVELAPLSRAESVELAESLLGGPIGGALAEALWHTTEGNPLYVRELIRTGVTSGAIQAQGDAWMLRSGLHLGARLPVLLSDRLADLPADARHAADVLAIAGPLPLALAERVIGEGALLSAESAGLVAAAGDTHGGAMTPEADAGPPDPDGGRDEPMVMVVHPLFTELLRDQVPPLRARQIGRDVAAAMRSSGPIRPADRLRCLVWEMDGGVPLDAGALLAGVTQAVQAQDPALAERLARAALALDGGRPARLALADALYRLGRPADGLEALGDETGDDDGDDEQRTQLAVLRVYLLNWGLGDFDSADEVINTALRSITDSSCRAWLVGLRASMDFFAGRPRDAVARAESLLALGGLTTRAQLGLYSGLGPALAFCGRYADAERLAQDGLTPAAATQDEVPVSISWAVGTLEVCYIFTGQVTELEHLAQQAYQAELQAGHDEGRSVSAACLGHAALSRGRIGTAMRWLAEARHTMGVDWGGLGLFTVGTLALAQVLHGDLDDARRTIDESREHTISAATAFVPVVDIAEAWLIASQGRPDRARDMLLRVADEAAAFGKAGFEVEALDAVARLGDAAAVADRLAALAGRLDSPLASLTARHARALADHDAQGLDTVAEQLAAQQLLARAGSAAAAAGALHEQLGRTAAAAASRERATAWLAGFDGTLPPDVTAWSAPRLTARERQICLLAATGATSRQIADELVISIRTVDGHLAAAYAKLGVSGRAELAQVLMADPTSVPPGTADRR